MFKTYTVVLLLFFICCGQNIMADACDESGVCKLPGASSEQENAVLSPAGKSSIKAIKQPSRLTTLKGKNIAIVGGSFMASVTHPELKRLILRDYPDAKVYVLSEIGSAGPWPGPGKKPDKNH